MRAPVFTPTHIAEKPCQRCGWVLWIYEGDDPDTITHCGFCKGHEGEPLPGERKRRKRRGWRYA